MEGRKEALMMMMMMMSRGQDILTHTVIIP